MYINQRTLLEFNHTFSIGNHFFPGLFVKHNSYSTETKKIYYNTSHILFIEERVPIRINDLIIHILFQLRHLRQSQ